MTEEVVNQEQGQAPGLSLQDIATAVQIIDICSRRGGFEGNELAAVGGLRERFVSFVQANTAKDDEAPQGEVPVAEVEEDSVES